MSMLMIPSSATGSSRTNSSGPGIGPARTVCSGSAGSSGSGRPRPAKGRRGTGKTAGPAVHDDLLARDFTAAGLDEKWLADITEHPTAEGKLYLCAFKDVCSNRIVGYALSDRMTAELAVVALRTAIARRQPSGTVIVHSDRGSPPVLNRSSQHRLVDLIVNTHSMLRPASAS